MTDINVDEAVVETAEEVVAETVTETVEETAADNTQEKKKRERKTEYHLMLFIDKKDGMIRQMGIESILVEVVAGVLAFVLLVSLIGWGVNSSKRKTAQADNEVLTVKVEELQASVDELTAENATLSDKVTILSDTVNAKVEQETTAQEELDTARYPEGFPLSTSASMTEDADHPNCVIFTCNAGASIISTGAGTVLEVLPDPDYGYCIRIDHNNGYVTEYYTSSTPLIKEGDEVLEGGVLALVENNDSKLIYKMYLDNEPIDPMTVIKIDG